LRRLLVLIHRGGLSLSVKSSKGWNHIPLSSASRLPALIIIVRGDSAECASKYGEWAGFSRLYVWSTKTATEVDEPAPSDSLLSIESESTRQSGGNVRADPLRKMGAKLAFSAPGFLRSPRAPEHTDTRILGRSLYTRQAGKRLLRPLTARYGALSCPDFTD
jgi:hypothetical protein